MIQMGQQKTSYLGEPDLSDCNDFQRAFISTMTENLFHYFIIIDVFNLYHLLFINVKIKHMLITDDVELKKSIIP